MSKLINRITPFIMLGLGIAVFVFGIIIFTYLFLFGAAIGLILYLINLIKQRFSPKKPQATPPKSNRIIDSDDWKVM